MPLIVGGILSVLKVVLGPLFTFLNGMVDADKQIQLTKVQTVGTVAADEMQGLQDADKLNAQIRQKEGSWGPTVLAAAVILVPFVWHEWLVVLDSCPFLLELYWYGGFLPLPELIGHNPGSWGVPGIGRAGPDGQSAWDKTEQAIFTSFFIGTSTALAAVAAIKAIKK
jgi:hypothetical protein